MKVEGFFGFLSLRWKIAGVGMIPLLFFAALSLTNLQQAYRTYTNAEETGLNLELTVAASNLVAELQKERGMSVSYLGGGINLSQLQEQRSRSDQKAVLLHQKLDTLAFTIEFRQSIRANLVEISAIRKRIDNGNLSAPEIVSKYTGLVLTLLDIQILAASETGFREVAESLRTLASVEAVKENGGKLRANMSGVFAKDKPIDVSKFRIITKLKNGVEYIVNSNTLVLSKKAKGFIDEFKNSTEWNSVLVAYRVIEAKRDVGNFGYDSGPFFRVISSALDILDKLIQHEIAQTREILQQNARRASSSMQWIVTSLLGAFLLLASLLYFLVQSLSGTLSSIAVRLSKGSLRVFDSSRKIEDGSVELSTANSRQASAIQQTVSTMDEINSTLATNARAAQESEKISTESSQYARDGREIINRMIDSVHEIERSNEELVAEVEQNRKEFTQVISIINEISDITKVINDIVFQTKLLSFNASVEAARAGVHGKGFSVVAEEVGNLAGMSGKSAAEITSKLDQSAQKVTEIVSRTQSRVQNLIHDSKEKVELSIQIAKQCEGSLGKIESSAHKVNSAMGEISLASVEQSKGVQEVTKAMQELDSIVQQNSVTAETTASNSASLRNEADGMNGLVESLRDFVNGRTSRRVGSSLKDRKPDSGKENPSKKAA